MILLNSEGLNMTLKNSMNDLMILTQEDSFRTLDAAGVVIVDFKKRVTDEK